MELETILRLEVNLFSLAILSVIFGSIVLRNREHRFVDSRLFLHIIRSLILIFILDSLGWILDGKLGAFNRTLLYVVDTLFFAIHILPMSMFLIYVDHYTASEKPLILSPYYWFAIAASVMCAIFALVSSIKGFLFRIEEGNIYVRGPLFHAFSIFNTFVGLLPVYLLVKRRKNIAPPSFFNLILYPILPLAGGSLQHVMYGTNLLWPATAISAFITFINVQNQQIDSDYLTGAFNRASLTEYSSILMRRARAGKTFAGIMLDLDEFKKINDNLGHVVGDQALVETARLLRASVRKSDFVARFGGDEFIVVLETESPNVLDEIAGRILANMKASNSKERPYTLSASMGKAIFDLEKDGNFDIFLHRLDRLMYCEKARPAGKK